MLKKIHKLKFLINSHVLLVFIITAIVLTVYAFLPNETQATVKPINYILFAILAVSGFYLLWQKKEVMEKELDSSKKEEEKEQSKREKAFSSKFPALNRIPVLRYLFRWIYKEGWVYILILGLLVVMAFVLRIMNLTVLEPYADEYIHLVAAMGINDHSSPTIFINGGMNEPYLRFSFLTYFIAFLFSAFGKSLFIARLPGVIISTLTAIPFYFIGRKINKKVGLITAALWVFSPWAIAIAKNIRGYAYFPFFHLLIGLFLIFFAKHLIQIIEKRDFKITFKRIISSAVFFLPFLYYFSDPDSTFKLAFILYAVFFAVLFYGLLRSKKLLHQTKKKIGVSLLILAPILIVIGYFNISPSIADHFKITPSLDSYWYSLILGNADTTFFYEANNYGFYIFFSLAVLFSIYRFIKNKSLTFNFLLLTFLGYFYFYLFHFDFMRRSRYGFTIYVWLIPLLAIAIYLIYKLFLYKQNKTKKIFISFFLSVFLLTVFNLKNIYKSIDLASYRKESGAVAFTGEYHERFMLVLDKYGGQIKKDDAIICSMCNPFYWHEKVELMENKVFYYPFYDENRFKIVHYVIKNNPSGWIIIDWARNDLSPGFPHQDFQYGSEKVGFIDVKFIERLGDFYVYRWYVK